jgi:Ni,Fe-hydrogenase I large subunit
MEVEQGRVKRYRIVAPTEWNFHPRGPLVMGLAGTAAVDEEEARRKALWLVQALDPCVACAIEVYHA